VLRGLILKIQNPSKWEALMNLEAHNDIRRTLPLWRENTINVVEVILRDYNLYDCFTEEEAHTVRKSRIFDILISEMFKSFFRKCQLSLDLRYVES
jgi:hypothetical protein